MIKSYPADACRTHAQKCLAKARLAGDNKCRAEFLDLFQQWETMAKDIEEVERLRKELKTDADGCRRRSGSHQYSVETNDIDQSVAVAGN
jgi:hypothetical protein